MSDVIFEEEQRSEQQIGGYSKGKKPSFMYRLLSKWGIAKSRKQASIILLTFAFILLLVSGFIFAQTQNQGRVPVNPEDLPDEFLEQLPPEIRLQMENSN